MREREKKSYRDKCGSAYIKQLLEKKRTRENNQAKKKWKNQWHRHRDVTKRKINTHTQTIRQADSKSRYVTH